MKKKENNNINLLSVNGLIEFVKSNLENPTNENILRAIKALVAPDKDLMHLTKDGELPWGWHTHTKEFTEKTKAEYSYFLDNWLDSRNKSPRDQYSSLKSFVLYLEALETLCKRKGECFEFWYYEILTSPDYLKRRKNELCDLETNFNELQRNYERRNTELVGLDSRIIKTLKENKNILQTDFVKMFDPAIQNDVKEKLYFMEKSGRLQRTKSGRSYILYYKE